MEEAIKHLVTILELHSSNIWLYNLENDHVQPAREAYQYLARVTDNPYYLELADELLTEAQIQAIEDYKTYTLGKA